MRVLRLLAFAGILLLLIFFGTRLRRVNATRAADVAASPTSRPTSAAPSAAAPSPPENFVSARSQALTRLAYAQRWDEPQPPALAAFRDWAERYRHAAPAARRALEAEGVALAQARRPAMLELIKTDPQYALAVTVPATLRQILPAAVLAELENRVAGRGDFGLHAAGAPEPGAPVRSGPALWRVALVNGVSYTAHAYGRREAQFSKEGASLHGIAL